MKTSQKSLFHPREAHILARLDITVLDTFFEVFKNIAFQLKTKGVSLRFYQKSLFTVKMDRKSIFHPHKAHIYLD
jgi:hypothetical protein